MTADKTTIDIQALAAEACDLWQEHLAGYATDPQAKAELMRLLSPSRQLFAEWASLMQNGPYGANFYSTSGSEGGTKPGAAGAGHQAASSAAATSQGPKTAGTTHVGGTRQLAELADRVAKLEARLAALESGSATKAQSPKSTPRPRTKS